MCTSQKYNIKVDDLAAVYVNQLESESLQEYRDAYLGAELSNEISEASAQAFFLNQVIKVRHPKVQQLEPEHGAFQVVSPFFAGGGGLLFR